LSYFPTFPITLNSKYDRFTIEKAKGNIEFKKTTNGVLIDEKGNPSKWNVYTKIWLKDRQDDSSLASTLASTTLKPLISLVSLPISKVYQIWSF